MNHHLLEIRRQMEYDSIYEQIAKGAIIRSKATWYEKGEKSNKYFLNLETHKKAKSFVRKVFNREGVLIVYIARILGNEPCKYYISPVEKAIRPIRFAYSVLHM